jgi:hypothetical protein
MKAPRPVGPGRLMTALGTMTATAQEVRAGVLYNFTSRMFHEPLVPMSMALGLSYCRMGLGSSRPSTSAKLLVICGGQAFYQWLGGQ